MTQAVVTQLIVDASGAQKGVADFNAAMDKAKKAANDTGNATASAFERAQQRWQDSLAKTDPVIRAQIQMQQALARQQAINTEAVKLGIATQEAAAAQLQRVNDKYQAYVDRAGAAGTSSKNLNNILGSLSTGFSKVTQLAASFGLVLGVGALVQYGKQVFSTTADLQEQADQILGAGGNVEALQAFRGVFLTNGIAMADGDRIIQRLNRTLGDAANGVKLAQDAFHRLGLGSKELAGQTADAALPLVAQKLLDIKDASTRASIEVQIFGRTGQQLESALRGVAQPVDQLIARAKELGIVIDADMIKKADDAKDRMAIAWQKLDVALAPIITNWVDGFVKFASSVDGTTSAISGLIKKVEVLGGAIAGARIGASVGGLPGAVAGGLIGTVGVGLATTDRTTQLNGIIASDEARLAQGNLDSAMRAAIKARIQHNLATVNAAVPFRGLVQLPGGTAAKAANDNNAPAWKPTPQDIAAYEKIKETFGGYLDELKQAADVSKLSASEKQIEANVIKAAIIDERAHGVAARDTSKTYADAVKYLGDEKANLVAILTIQAQINAFTQQQNDEITSANAGLAVDADHRALVLKNVQDELRLGILVGDQYKDQRATLEAKNAQIQDIQDETKTRDYLDNLKEETSLAGMSADERERESAVLQVMHMNNGKITDDLANQVRGAVGLRQEMQKVGQASDAIQNGFEDFFANVLNHGKNAFGQLVDVIKQQFIKLLAYMAAQAIAQPIIVPVIEAVTGGAMSAANLFGAGGTGGAAGGGIGNLLGSLGQLGSSGTTAGGTGFLGQIGSSISSATSWLTNGINSLGSSLGFSAGTSFGGISTVGVTPSVFGTGGFAAPNIAGSSSLLGGATLMGMLGSAIGGYGIGSLGASLLGGNASSSQQTNGMIGSAIGASIGSVVPVIGTFLGSALGGLVGGLIGPKASAHRATANFDSNYAITDVTGTKMTAQSQQAATTAGQSISQVVQSLENAGLTLSNNISKLTISQSRDQSFITTSDGKRINVGKPGDEQAAVQGTLDYLLKGMTSADNEVQKVIDHYKTLGGVTADNANQFAQDVQFAKSLESISFDTTKQISQTQQAMNALNDQFQQAIDKAKSLGLDITNIVKAQAAAVKAIQDQFNKSIQDSLNQLVDPIAYQFDQLIATQQQRLSDAQAIGADISQVDALNKAEIANALQSYKDAVTQAQENLAAAKGQTGAQTVSEAQSQLEQAYNAKASDLNNTISQFTGIAQTIRQAIDQIVSSLGTSLTGTVGIAHQQFLSAVAGSKSGNLDAFNALPQTAQAYLQAVQQTAATPEQLAIAQSQVRSSLEDAAKAADKNVSVAQQQLNTLNKQVSGLVAINDNVISVAQAIKNLQAAQASAVSSAQAQLATAISNLKEAQSASASAPTSATVAMVAAAASVAATTAAISATSSTSSSIPASTPPNISQSYIQSFLSGLKNVNLSHISTFASGGDFGGGWRVVGERGPELENTGPSRVISNANSKSLFDSSGIVSELQRLRAEVASLRAEQGKSATKTADATKKTADILRRVTRDGNSIVTEAA